MNAVDDHILVIFGASGDLARRKLIPALYNLYRGNHLPEKFLVLGASRTELNDETFREKMHENLQASKNETYQERDVGFIGKLFYVSMNTEDPEAYGALREKIGELHAAVDIPQNYIFYMATPPKLYEIVARGLAGQDLNRQMSGWRRLIVEKPFGTSLRSAIALNKNLLNFFSEDQIFRIDHYLGKETVQNIMVTRFSNGIFEPLWNRNYIHHVEITAAESIGVGERGGYYDRSGALRDMVQNHLMQLLTLVAMEPPTLMNSSSIRNETLKVLQSIRPYTQQDIASNVIRGQYLGSTILGKEVRSYRKEKGVLPESRTETFVALKLYVDSWRWGGVPFYFRTGKRLPTSVTEIVIHFNSTPHKLFRFDKSGFNSDNQLIIRIQPDEGILIKFGVKLPGTGFNVREVNMDFHYSDFGNSKLPEAYQRLLLDCMQGDATLYTRADAVEEAWKFVDPILREWRENCDLQVYGYPGGTWGPLVSDSLIEGENMTWRYPCKNLVDDGTYCEL